MEKVNILLSTYNGEKFIREQMDSLLAQTYPNTRIYVRDDNSKDGTGAILQEYCEKHRDKIIVIEDALNLGYPDCFWEMLEKCDDADFYAFCDQDDVWKPEKIERAVAHLQGKDGEVLYIHDYDICDGNLKSFGRHHIENMEKKRGEQLLFYTIAQGFSMVINHKMRQMLLKESVKGKNIPHDGWCIWNAFFGGEMVYDATVLAYYRRHGETVTNSGMKKGIMIKSWFKKEIFGDEMFHLEQRAMYFLECIGNRMGMEEQKVWRMLAQRPKSGDAYFKRLFYPRRLRPGYGGELALRILFLLNQ